MDLGSVCESNAYGSVTLVCGPIGLGRYAQQDRVRVKAGETYRQPQATGRKLQAASRKQQATSLTKQDSGTIKDVERINYESNNNI